MGLPGRAYLCYFDEEVINEILGRAGVEGGLMVADAAGDEVFQAPEVPEKALVRPGQPVQEARKEVVPLRKGQSRRGLEELAGCVRLRIRWAGAGS